ncbi:MAG: rhodanese-like domain-containing protein [Bacteroidota bacterium]
MKELERTKRISVSAVLFLLIVVIGVLMFEKPQYVFEKNPANTLEEVTKQNFILTLNDFKSLEPSQYVLIDIRNNFEYAKGHLDGAINVSPHQVFKPESKKLLKQTKDDGKTVVLYGANADKASNAWLLLYQLGYENIKILCVETNYIDNKLSMKEVAIEKPSVNYAEIIREAKAKQAIQKITEVKKPVAPKKVITKPKKKKRVPEGGC